MLNPKISQAFETAWGCRASRGGRADSKCWWFRGEVFDERNCQLGTGHMLGNM
jgi:hypothetical protein